MGDCVFCEIVKGKSPASIFYKDDVVVGFMDIDPMTTGHVEIIPKVHFPFIGDMDEETGRHLWTIAHRTAVAIRKSDVRCEGINLFLADGEAAFQEIFHVHLHVFPRYEGDYFRVSADWGKNPPRDELDRVAQQIKEAYQKLWGSDY